jgi:hypothetical protein
MCFGGSSKPQVVSSGSQQITDKSWETLEPYIKNVLESSRSRFEDELEKGYEAFPGGYEGRYEGPSVEELASREGILQQGLSGIAGTGMASSRPYYEGGLSALSSSMDQFGPQQAQQYMNPYQQAVVDVAKREAVRQAQPTFRSIGDRAESVGAFGGSRQAIAEAEANRNLQQQLSDIQTRGMQSAFEQGRSAFEAQKAREAAASQRMFAQAPLAFQQGIRELGAVEEVGRARRGDEQAKKDYLYEQFEQEKLFPSKTFTEHLGHVRGFPYQPSMYKTTTNMQPRPSMGRQLLGGAMGLASIGKNLNLFQSGGQIQGGLSGLIQRHQNNTVDIVGAETEMMEGNTLPPSVIPKPTASIPTMPTLSGTDYDELYLANLDKAGSLYDILREKVKERGSTAYKEKRKAELAKDRTDAAWDQLGKVGAAMMSAPGHMGILQALGYGVKETGAMDKLSEARKEERKGIRELDDQDLKTTKELAALDLNTLKIENEIIKAAQAGDLKKAELLAKRFGTKLKLAKFELDVAKYGNDIAKLLASDQLTNVLASGDKARIRAVLEQNIGKYGLSGEKVEKIMSEADKHIASSRALLPSLQRGGTNTDGVDSLDTFDWTLN